MKGVIGCILCQQEFGNLRKEAKQPTLRETAFSAEDCSGGLLCLSRYLTGLSNEKYESAIINTTLV